jgi:hypothetical protein
LTGDRTLYDRRTVAPAHEAQGNPPIRAAFQELIARANLLINLHVNEQIK